MTEKELKRLHNDLDEDANKDGPWSCYDCLSYLEPFPPTTKYAGDPYICPKCGIDSIVRQNLDIDTLKKMHNYWFEHGVDMSGKTYCRLKTKPCFTCDELVKDNIVLGED